MRKIAIAGMLALCLTLLITPVASAAGISITSKIGDGAWVGDNWQVAMYPAETKTAVLTLYNSSSSSLDVEVSVIPTSLDDDNVTFEVDSPAFTMSGKAYADITLTASASGSATPGVYEAEFELKFEIASSGGGGGGGGGGGVGALQITDIEVNNITETSAEITFRTNRGATTRLTYWASAETVIRDSGYTTRHTVILEGLNVCTEYQFEIKCEDKYGLRDTEYGVFITLCIEPSPTPTPTPMPTPTPPTTTPPATTPPVTTIPPETTPEVGTYWWPLLWAGIGLAVIALGVLAWWWFKVKKKTKKQSTLDKK